MTHQKTEPLCDVYVQCGSSRTHAVIVATLPDRSILLTVCHRLPAVLTVARTGRAQ